MSFWLKNNKIVINSKGHVVQCVDCPCKHQIQPLPDEFQLFINVIDITVPNKYFLTTDDNTTNELSNWDDYLIGNLSRNLSILSNEDINNNLSSEYLLIEDKKGQTIINQAMDYITDNSYYHLYLLAGNNIDIIVYREKAFSLNNIDSYRYSQNILQMGYEEYKNTENKYISLIPNANEIKENNKLITCYVGITKDNIIDNTNINVTPVFKFKEEENIKVINTPLYITKEYYVDRIITGVSSGYLVERAPSGNNVHELNFLNYCIKPNINDNISTLYFYPGNDTLIPTIYQNNRFVFFDGVTTISCTQIEGMNTREFIWHYKLDSIPPNASTYVNNILTEVTGENSEAVWSNYFCGDIEMDIYDWVWDAHGWNSKSQRRPLTTHINNEDIVWDWQHSKTTIPPYTSAILGQEDENNIVQITHNEPVTLTYKHFCNNIEIKDGQKFYLKLSDILTCDLSTQFDYDQNYMFVLPEGSQAQIDEEWVDILSGKYIDTNFGTIPPTSKIKTIYPCFVITEDKKGDNNYCPSGFYSLKEHNKKYSVLYGHNFSIGNLSAVSNAYVTEENNSIKINWNGNSFNCQLGHFFKDGNNYLYKLSSADDINWEAKKINDNDIKCITSVIPYSPPPYYYDGSVSHDIFSSYYVKFDDIYFYDNGEQAIISTETFTPSKTSLLPYTKVNVLTTTILTNSTSLNWYKQNNGTYTVNNIKLTPNETILCTKVQSDENIYDWTPSLTSIPAGTKVNYSWWDPDTNEWQQTNQNEDTLVQYCLNDNQYVNANSIFVTTTDYYNDDNIPSFNDNEGNEYGQYITLQRNVWITNYDEIQGTLKFIKLQLNNNESVKIFLDINSNSLTYNNYVYQIGNGPKVIMNYPQIYVVSNMFNWTPSLTQIPPSTHILKNEQKISNTEYNITDIYTITYDSMLQVEITYYYDNMGHYVYLSDITEKDSYPQLKGTTVTYSETVFNPSVNETEGEILPYTTALLKTVVQVTNAEEKPVTYSNGLYTCNGYTFENNAKMYKILLGQITGNVDYNILSFNKELYFLIKTNYFDYKFGNQLKFNTTEKCSKNQLEKIYNNFSNDLDKLYYQIYSVRYYFDNNSYLNNYDTNLSNFNMYHVYNGNGSEYVILNKSGVYQLSQTSGTLSLCLEERDNYLFRCNGISKEFGITNLRLKNYIEATGINSEIIRFNIDTITHPQLNHITGVKCIILTSFSYNNTSQSDSYWYKPGTRGYGYITGVLKVNTLYDFGINPFTYETYRTNSNITAATSSIANTFPPNPTIRTLHDILTGLGEYHNMYTFTVIKPIQLVSTINIENTFDAYIIPQTLSTIFKENDFNSIYGHTHWVNEDHFQNDTIF